MKHDVNPALIGGLTPDNAEKIRTILADRLSAPGSVVEGPDDIEVTLGAKLASILVDNPKPGQVAINIDFKPKRSNPATGEPAQCSWQQKYSYIKELKDHFLFHYPEYSDLLPLALGNRQDALHLTFPSERALTQFFSSLTDKKELKLCPKDQMPWRSSDVPAYSPHSVFDAPKPATTLDLVTLIGRVDKATHQQAEKDIGRVIGDFMTRHSPRMITSVPVTLSEQFDGANQPFNELVVNGLIGMTIKFPEGTTNAMKYEYVDAMKQEFLGRRPDKGDTLPKVIHDDDNQTVSLTFDKKAHLLEFFNTLGPKKKIGTASAMEH